MSDIVVRLRQDARDCAGFEIFDEAADEIERLRAQMVERLVRYCVCSGAQGPVEGCECVCCTTERLRHNVNDVTARYIQAAGQRDAAWSDNERLEARIDQLLAFDANKERELATLEADNERLRADAERYRWVRERMEVRPQTAVSGSVRNALSVRIGCSFLDSEVSKRRSLSDPDAHENGCKKFDTAIDAALKETAP